MQHWVDFKDLIAGTSGFDRGSLHVLASVPLHVVCALLLRRPLTSLWPWLLVLAIAGGNEAASGYADGRLEDWEIPGSLRDLLLVMALPTFLAIALRLRLLSPAGRRPPPSRTLPMLPVSTSPREIIVDAEFEEIR